MNRHIFFLFLVFSISVNGQSSFSDSWQGYFSYNNVVDISASSDKIYAAAENAFFTYDLNSNELEKFSSIDGLSGQNITTAYFSENNEKFVLGYDNGLIEVFFEDTKEVKRVVDVVNKPTIAPDKKALNHILEYNGLLYIASDFGITLYDLERLEFGDTFFIGESGAQIEVRQTTISGDYIYAATEAGIYRALVDNDNLIDFEEWERVITSNWLGVQSFAGELYAISLGRRLYRYNGVTFVVIPEIPIFESTLKDFKANDTFMTVSINEKVHIYDAALNEVHAIEDLGTEEEFVDIAYNTGFLLGQDIYLGTTTYGMLKTAVPNIMSVTQILPDGPSSNNAFSVTAFADELWVVYGDYDVFYNPYPLDTRGVSHFEDLSWTNIPYTEEFDARSLVHVTVNPSHRNQAYISSFFSGILEIVDDEPVQVLNETNSGLESLMIPGFPTYIDVRVDGTAFDNEGNFWVLNSKVEFGIKVLRSSGAWDSYSITEVLGDFLNGENALARLAISDSGIKFIGTYKNGLWIFDETRSEGNRIKKIGVEESGNLPVFDIRSLAIDKRGNLWIGTTKGLRVLFGADNAINIDNPQTSEIIIEGEDGVPEELLFQQIVTDIEVDGSNNKWIATSDSGVFYFSPDGSETLAHFTTDNSPLPVNNVNSIELDGETGTVYMATNRGIVSFNGTATDPNETLEDVYAYPNPVRPGFEGQLTISGLVSNANIKITDIEGNLVHETTSEGGTVQWDLRAFGKHKVASGVYMILIANEDGTETKVTKVMVVR